jgi:hypothetical protein
LKTFLAASVGGILSAAAGVAAASNFASDRQVDYFTSGTHQFYVWCAGHSGDYTTTAVGPTAEQAQINLYRSMKAAGKLTCWPVWQGRVQQ